MEIIIGTFEAKNKLSALLDRVEMGDTVIIMRRGKRIARLTRDFVETDEKRPKFGCMKGQIEVGEGFREPLDDFADYM